MAEASDNSELLDEALEKFEIAKTYWSSNYEKAKEDYLFRYGIGQWDDAYVADRRASGRPCLTLNLMNSYANQVINDIRQSRPAIRVSPVDDKADVDTAEIYSGIIRNIERQSKANIAYDTAASNAVSAGIGFIRISTDYADPMSFDQEIFINRVLDFSSVYIDPNSTELDGSDAEFAFAYVDIPCDEFEERFPDAIAQEDEKESVRVIEYFYREYDSYKIYKTPQGVITAAEKDLLEETGLPIEVLDERETLIPKIKHCVLTEDEILEANDWVGKYIPIVPVFGLEYFKDDKRVFESLIAQAKDAQKMHNYWNSFDTELVTLQPTAPFIAPVGSFETTPNKWQSANIKNYAYLEYDPVYDENGQLLPPPQKQMPIQGSAHIMQKCVMSREDVGFILGMPPAVMGQKSNELSGVAVRNRQVEGDNATFHFIDNLACAISHVGVILVDLIQKLYSERKIARIIGLDSEEKTVPINQPYVKDETGIRPAKQGEQFQGVYDLNAGKYDVVCDIGASFSSKRQEAADTLIQVTQAQPELFGVVGDLLFKSLDIPYGQEIADRLKANMNPALFGDDPQAAKLQEASAQIAELQDQLTTLSAALADKKKDEKFNQQLELQKIELDRTELEIKAAETAAKIAQMNAQTQNINEQALAPVLQAITEIATNVQDVGQALDLILTNEEQALGEPIANNPQLEQQT